MTLFEIKIRYDTIGRSVACLNFHKADLWPVIPYQLQQDKTFIWTSLQDSTEKLMCNTVASNTLFAIFKHN